MTPQTEPNDDGLRKQATVALAESLRAILASPAGSDLADALPVDFAEALLDLAWRHQFDLDKARFRREVKNYLRGVATTAAGEVAPNED